MNSHPGLGFRLVTILTFALCATSLPLHAASTTIVDDSWTDGGRSNGADPLDSNWWTSNSPNAIEVSAGQLGLVSGSSGRGIHTIFPTRTLSVGDRLVATYTFTTPATVRTFPAGFRIGLFDTLDRAGLDADVPASSAAPNPLYGNSATATPGLPGYMMTMDVGLGNDHIAFRKHDTTASTGLLLGTTIGFTVINPTDSSDGYFIQPGTTYTGSFALKRITATEMELTGALGTYTYSNTSTFDSASFGMLAFLVRGDVFGGSNVPNEPDNGIDFSNVRIEFHPAAVPEPSTFTLFGVAALGVVVAARRRRSGQRRPPP
jgi:hypothetical protein